MGALRGDAALGRHPRMAEPMAAGEVAELESLHEVGGQADLLEHFDGATGGHHPDAVSLEAMAQAGGILASRTIQFDPATHVMVFMAIDAVKFRRAVTPGDQLIIGSTVLEFEERQKRTPQA